MAVELLLLLPSSESCTKGIERDRGKMGLWIRMGMRTEMGRDR